jgi:hypothetical protein
VAEDIHTGSEHRGLSTASTQEEFADALREFGKELEVARREGLPAPVVEQVAQHVEAAGREAQQATPRLETICEHLEQARGALIAAGDQAEVAEELLPFVQAGIQVCIGLFSGEE